jgi:hypothetical protein
MEMYKRMYFMLFNDVTDAMEALEQGNFRLAKNILCRAQQKTEDYYITHDED